MMTYANGMDPKHFIMAFYDCLASIKLILGDFDFFRFLCTRAASSHAAQKLRPCKIIKKPQKYAKIADFAIKMASTAAKKCSKHLFRVA